MSERLLKNVPPIEMRAAVASLAASLVLTLLKFVAYFSTNSSAIFSDAVESIVNVAASSFALYSLYLSHQPADAEHPYGHGKVEFISAAVEGGMVLVAALVAVVKAIDALLHHSDFHVNRLVLGLSLLTGAMIVNGLLGLGLMRIGRQQDSATLLADGRHLLSDAFTSLAAILGLLVVHYTGWKHADPLAAIVVAVYITLMGVDVLRGAVAGLMDRQDDSDQKLLRSILDAHVEGREPRICSYHKLRHRHSGRYHWVDFHIMVPAEWSIKQGHEVASSIEYEIENALGIGNATAHVEPCPARDCASCESFSPLRRSHKEWHGGCTPHLAAQKRAAFKRRTTMPSNHSAYAGVDLSAQGAPAADPDRAIGHLNSMLRGEIAAAETYRMAIDRVSQAESSNSSVGLLRGVQEEHGRAAQAVRDRIRELGGEPSDASGPWGVWAKTIQGIADLLGNTTGLRALKEGEEHGLRDYQDALDNVDPTSRQLIQNQFIPAQERHVGLLEQMISLASNGS